MKVFFLSALASVEVHGENGNAPRARSIPHSGDEPLGRENGDNVRHVDGGQGMLPRRRSHYTSGETVVLSPHTGVSCDVVPSHVPLVGQCIDEVRTATKFLTKVEIEFGLGKESKKRCPRSTICSGKPPSTIFVAMPTTLGRTLLHRRSHVGRPNDMVV